MALGNWVLGHFALYIDSSYDMVTPQGRYIYIYTTQPHGALGPEERGTGLLITVPLRKLFQLSTLDQINSTGQ